MTTLAFYLLKVFICSGLLFSYYHLALRNKIFHQWNRFYLLSAVVLSLVLPLLQITLQPDEQNNVALFLHSMQSANDYLEEIVITNHKHLSSEQWMAFGYSIVCLLLLVAFLRSLFKIFSLIRSHTISFFKNIRFINTNVAGTPFSFFNYIFWNENISLQSATGQQIFQHELVHVKEKHTLDKLFMQIVLVFFWCNPFFWLIRKELRFLHEFIADKKAVAGNDMAAFAAMILQAAYPQQFHSITNQFFQTSIKRRLAMLTKIQNPKQNYFSRIIALPLVALVVFAFSLCTREHRTDLKNNVSTSQKENSPVLIADTVSKSQYLLFSVDGKEIKPEEFININSKDIDSIKMLTGKAAIDKYGEKAKYVIELTMRKNKSNEKTTMQMDGKIYTFDSLKVKISGKNVQGSFTTANEDANNKVADQDVNNKVFEQTETPASIDKMEWRKFLEPHFQPIIENAASKGLPPGTYTVNVRFLVKKDGSLADFKALNDPGYDLAKQVLALMPNSPKWTPAMQNGKPVNSYHTQPVTFVIQEQ